MFRSVVTDFDRLTSSAIFLRAASNSEEEPNRPQAGGRRKIPHKANLPSLISQHDEIQCPRRGCSCSRLPQRSSLCPRFVHISRPSKLGRIDLHRLEPHRQPRVRHSFFLRHQRLSSQHVLHRRRRRRHWCRRQGDRRMSRKVLLPRRQASHLWLQPQCRQHPYYRIWRH